MIVKLAMYSFSLICAVATYYMVYPIAIAISAGEYAVAVFLTAVGCALLTSFNYWWDRAENGLPDSN